MCRGIAIQMTAEEVKENFKRNYEIENQYFSNIIKNDKDNKLSFFGKIVKGKWYFFIVLSDLNSNTAA